MRLCINPDCGTIDRENPDTATNCEECGSELLVHEIYAVKRLLSNKGGFGTVYEIESAANRKQVLKVLKPSLNDEPRTVELFQQEAYLLQQIDTPALPKIAAYIHHPLPDGKILHAIVMEKIAGCNLLEWSQARQHEPISEIMAREWLREIVTSLDLVHQQNYFHRDIKPSNIMLAPTGRLVLIDFGSARHESFTYLDKLYGAGGITQISSLGYTAPEQERGFAVAQSDFYAVGMTFIDLVTGKYPLDMYDANLDVYHWRDFVPQLTPAFADLLDTLIANKPIDRPHSCASIIHSLDEIENPPPIKSDPNPEKSVWIDRIRIGIGVVVMSSIGYLIAANYRLLPSPFHHSAPASSQANVCAIDCQTKRGDYATTTH